MGARNGKSFFLKKNKKEVSARTQLKRNNPIIATPHIPTKCHALMMEGGERAQN